MYKLSNYNIIVEHNENILLYNTLSGEESICKMPAKYKDCFEKFRRKDFDDEQIRRLCIKGFIVHEDFDELSKLHCVAIDAINNNNILNLIINPTEKCNFRCKYCYESFENGIMSRETQEEIINFVRHNINKYSGLQISWFGGEPLLAVDVIKYMSECLIDICKKNRKSYKAGITTNGYLLNMKTFEMLLSIRVLNYQITLDGFKEVHDKQRVDINGKPTFEVVYNNLLEIKQKKRQDFIVNIRINFSQDSFDNIENVFETLSFAEGDRRFLISPHIVGNWLETIDDSMKDVLIPQNNYLLILKKIYEYPKIFYIPFDFGIGGQLCYAFKKNCFHISSTGKIGKCTVAYEDDNHRVGQIRNAKFEPNLTFYEWVAKYNCDYEKCKFAPICQGFLCKVINKNNVCNRKVDVIEQTLKIFDKNGKIKYL